MTLADVLVLLAILVIVGLAVAYIYRAKKKGVHCIGCPAAGGCSGHCSGAAACGCHAPEDAPVSPLEEPQATTAMPCAGCALGSTACDETK